jgi:putative transposase
LAYPLSYRNLEDMAEELGYNVDHSTINRWLIKYSPELEKLFQERKRSVGVRWRMDETLLRSMGNGNIFTEQSTKKVAHHRLSSDSKA